MRNVPLHPGARNGRMAAGTCPRRSPVTGLVLPFALGLLSLGALATTAGAADEGTRVSAAGFNACVAGRGSEVFYEDGDDIVICRWSSGVEIWCDNDFSECEMFEPANEYPGPGTGAITGTPTTTTAGTPATAAPGTAAPAAGGAIQLHIQR